MQHRNPTSPRLCLYVCAILCYLSQPAVGAYQFEVIANHAQGEGDLTDTNINNIHTTWYWAPVSDTTMPLDEAGFLSQTSSLGYGYTQLESEVEPRPLIFITPINPPLFPPFRTHQGGGFRRAIAPSITTELDQHQISYTHIHKPSGWFGLIRASDTQGGNDGFVPTDINGTRIRAAIGRYFTPTSTVQLYVERNDEVSKTSLSTTCSIPTFFCIGLTSRSKAEKDDLIVGLAAKHVGQFTNRYYAISGFVQHTNSEIDLSIRTVVTDNPLNLPIPPLQTTSFSLPVDDIWSAGVNATWYATRSSGISAGYTLTDAGSNQDQTYTLAGHWYVRPQFVVRINFLRTHLEGMRDDIDQVGISLGARF